MNGDNAIDQSTWRKWFPKFTNGNLYLKDAPRSGHSVTTDSAQINIDSNRHITIRDIAEILEISAITVSRHIHNLGLTKKLDY